MPTLLIKPSKLITHFYKYLITSVLLIGLFQVCHANILELDKTSKPSQIKKIILVDASNLFDCQKESVIGAKCIPANTFQSEKGELASFYHTTWVLGTAGIQGSEELLVFADNDNNRDALLGLLYLAGQKKLWRWNDKKSDLQELLGQEQGQTRSIVRSKYYTAKMRDKHLVLPKELEPLMKQGWRLSAEDKLSRKQTIVTDKLPLETLARFTRLFLLKTKNQMLKILIHSPIKESITLKSSS
ncbi:MAG: hypothetical protein V7749_17105 [Cocleimonas sp.]